MRFIHVLLVLVTFVIGSRAIYAEDAASNPTVIKIGTFSRAIDYAPYYVAKSRGLLDTVAKNHNARIEYIEFQSLPAINEAFASKNLDLVFEAEVPAIVGRAAGIGLKIVGTSADVTFEVLVPATASTKSVVDLKGKKIAVLSGTSAHYGVNKVLSSNGITKRDVELIDMTPPDAKVAFESNQVDAWAVWPPFQQQEEVNGKGRALPDSSMFIQSIAVTREDLIKNNAPLIKGLISQIKDAQVWILKNEKEAQGIVAQELTLPLPVVEKAWPHHDFNPTITQSKIDDMQVKADFLREIGLVKNRVNIASELVTGEFK